MLRALSEYGRSNGGVTTGFADKSIGFVLEVDDDARGGRLIPLYQTEETPGGKTRFVPQAARVPNVVRTVKAVPMLACDNASYVLGRPKASDDPVKREKEKAAAATKREEFDALLAEYGSEHDDPDVGIFLKWRKDGCPNLAESIAALDSFSTKRLDMDLIAIRVGSRQLLHGKAEAQAFWGARAIASKSSGTERLCLSCAMVKPVVDRVPQSLIGALVPATSTSNVALVSSNFPAAARGASGTGLKSAPICAVCATSAVSAFNELAASDTHRWGGRSEDRASIWWTKDGVSDFNALEDPSPEQVSAFLKALDKGRRPVSDLEAPDRFYALSFSGNVARLVIRQWIDLPLAEAHRNVMAWFDDSAGPVVGRPHFSVSEMARSCGDFIPSDGLFAAMPEGSREVLLRCALVGSRLPANLLVRAIRRARAESHYQSHNDSRVVGVVRRRSHARFALIRITLNRAHLKEKPLSQHLDESREEPSYLYGRLFAERESLQYRALGDVNASIADRYFDRASANPASVEHTLASLEKQHLKALRRNNSEAVHIAFDKRIGDLHDRGGAAPARLSIDDQALWIAGYYQQRQENFRRANENKQKTTQEN